MKGIEQNVGYKDPVIKDTDFFFGEGNLPRIVLQEKGDWTDSLPTEEWQNIRDIETSNCTAFATTNQIEMYEYKAFGERNNYSDRFLGIMAGTSSLGNDPSKVYDAIRKYGLIPEELCPWSEDITSTGEYYSFKGVDKEKCLQAGRDWLATHDFMHNWVFQATAPLDEKINNMKVALRYSPLCLDVSAWETNAEGRYIRFGLSGHWTTCYAIRDIEKVFDSYAPFLKELVHDFNHSYCKRISITKKKPLTLPQKRSLWELIKSLWPFGEEAELKKVEPDLNPDFVSPKTRPTIVKTNTEKLIEVVKASIDTDASPENKASSEVGCAESMSNLIHSVFPEFPKGVISTANLYNALRNSSLFKGVLEPKAGCIVISPRTETINGHVGCFVTDTRIVSNDSETGLMADNYGWPGWIKEFKDTRGLRIYLFQLK